jgi:hypothetical protein
MEYTDRDWKKSQGLLSQVCNVLCTLNRTTLLSAFMNNYQKIEILAIYKP